MKKEWNGLTGMFRTTTALWSEITWWVVLRHAYFKYLLKSYGERLSMTYRLMLILAGRVR